MEHLHKLMEKRSKKEPAMDDNRKAAKMAALKELHNEMKSRLGEGLGDHLESLKKVTVAAPDKSHLEKGLEAAKGMVSNLPEDEESPEHEAAETPEMEAAEHEDVGEEEEQEMPGHGMPEQLAEHAESEEGEIADLKRQIEELKQLILSSRQG